MRVSCDPKDQGFCPAYSSFRATLNGLPVPHAITADEELGVVHIYANNKQGDVIEQVLFGRVKIERVH